MITIELFIILREWLRNEVFNGIPPDMFEEEFYIRQEEWRNSKNRDYYTTNVEFFWCTDNGTEKIFIGNSQNPDYLRRLEISVSDDPDSCGHQICVFALNRNWLSLPDDYSREFVDFDTDQIDDLKAFILEFIRWRPEFLEIRDAGESRESTSSENQETSDESGPRGGATS